MVWSGVEWCGVLWSVVECCGVLWSVVECCGVFVNGKCLFVPSVNDGGRGLMYRLGEGDERENVFDNLHIRVLFSSLCPDIVVIAFCASSDVLNFTNLNDVC